MSAATATATATTTATGNKAALDRRVQAQAQVHQERKQSFRLFAHELVEEEEEEEQEEEHVKSSDHDAIADDGTGSGRLPDGARKPSGFSSLFAAVNRLADELGDKVDAAAADDNDLVKLEVDVAAAGAPRDRRRRSNKGRAARTSLDRLSSCVSDITSSLNSEADLDEFPLDDSLREMAAVGDEDWREQKEEEEAPKQTEALATGNATPHSAANSAANVHLSPAATRRRSGRMSATPAQIAAAVQVILQQQDGSTPAIDYNLQSPEARLKNRHASVSLASIEKFARRNSSLRRSSTLVTARSNASHSRSNSNSIENSHVDNPDNLNLNLNLNFALPLNSNSIENSHVDNNLNLNLNLNLNTPRKGSIDRDSNSEIDNILVGTKNCNEVLLEDPREDHHDNDDDDDDDEAYLDSLRILLGDDAYLLDCDSDDDDDNPYDRHANNETSSTSSNNKGKNKNILQNMESERKPHFLVNGTRDSISLAQQRQITREMEWIEKRDSISLALQRKEREARNHRCRRDDRRNVVVAEVSFEPQLKEGDKASSATLTTTAATAATTEVTTTTDGNANANATPDANAKANANANNKSNNKKGRIGRISLPLVSRVSLVLQHMFGDDVEIIDPSDSEKEEDKVGNQLCEGVRKY
eukprot:CAMPEP_0171416784 /NCGR_PEP_ID=MMETSP0880-20121228/40271_1 /TAXON_ID=67004 /ORGANISM="Thalassiosira weissflogii, Strain CCMP1336" /LENGTH=643 /DNA_ID=CAMNT_0011935039 /DNA_START=22 /DNA_END=1954 /DNA_ORIENTATION=-